MRKDILAYINKLQAYKTAIKNLHWSSKKMSEHKLLDEIADSLNDNQDEIAEIAQGIYGKIRINQLKPRRYNISNSKKMLNDLTKDTKDFCEILKGKNLTGLRSVVESFIGELNKFDYLMDMCIKEDIKRKYKNTINEEKKMHNIIENSIKNVISENASLKRKYINRIYKNKGVDMYLHHRFSDNDWHYLHEFFDKIEEVPGVVDLDVRVDNGGYRENNGSKWKEYKVSIELETGDMIEGIVNCNFCGSSKDVTDAYDITFTMW